MSKWLKHVANCPVCQEKMLEGKDAFGLGILLTSEEQFKQALDKYQE